MHGYLSSSATALLTLSAVLASGGSAGAQSPCADEYIIQPGDTLYQVTQQCRVQLSALLEANPQIDNIDNIQVGARLEIPGASSGTDGAPPPQTGYRVAPGDTLFSIAERHGLSVDALIEANPGLDINDLEIGLTLRLPGGTPGDGEQIGQGPGEPTIHVQPLAGGPGAPITVTGDNYTPGRTVQVGVGPQNAEWRALERTRVQPDGEVEAHVRIPDSARPGRQLVFVINTPEGRTEVSQPIDVVPNRDPDAPENGPVARTEEGRLEQGAECLVLQTPNGQSYSLTGVAPQFDAGDYVRVAGRTADASFCMQGAATIEVERMTYAQP